MRRGVQGVAAADEEGRAGAACLQGFEHQRRVKRVRAVVEGQRDPAPEDVAWHQRLEQ
jgi:hypothetical protein